MELAVCELAELNAKDTAAVGQAIAAEILQAIENHQKKYHPICDPKELDQTLRALREYWEHQRRIQR